MTNTEYKRMLIDNILEWQTRNQITREELERKTIRTLEIIHDNIDWYRGRKKHALLFTF